MATRRHFIKSSVLTLPVIGALSCNDHKEKGLPRPIVISTWQDGKAVNEAAWSVISKEGSALDAVESGAKSIEDKIVCCVGLGGNPDREGRVTLDACIMDDRFNCGSVAFLERIKHPISVARKVMEDTPHVYMVGEGAQQFAISKGFVLEAPVLSPDAQKAYQEWLVKSDYKPEKNIEDKHHKEDKKLDKNNHDTMALLAIDNKGAMAGACTTSGLAFKMRGRVGDSPIIGGGLYVDPEVGAVTATGQGEEIVRAGGASHVISLMRSGLTPQEACKQMVERIAKINPEKAKDFQAAFIAIDIHGNYGGYALQNDFHYCIHTSSKVEIIPSASYFK
jgi:N4-(beta-N-acetylglucosaminyl)-L-asparaginase